MRGPQLHTCMTRLAHACEEHYGAHAALRDVVMRDVERTQVLKAGQAPDVNKLVERKVDDAQVRRLRD